MDSESSKERDIQPLEQAENASGATAVQELSGEVIDQVEAVLDASEISCADRKEKIKPKKTWVEKVAECQNQDDFLNLFQGAGIAGDDWKSSGWLAKKAKLSTEKGGIGQNLSGLSVALQKKFQGYPQFVAWMEGKDAPERIWGKKDVEECQSPDDFLRLFQELGIRGDKWKSSKWLVNKAKLSIEEGGIGKNLSGLSQAIRKRFQGYSNFMAWVEGKDTPERILGKKNVEGCQSPDDFLRLFQALKIPSDKWKSSNWLYSKAKLSIEEGGIGKNLSGLTLAIRQRFQGYPQFVAWMERKDAPEQTWVQKVDGYKSQDDFLRLFQELGIPGNIWKSSNWLGKIAKLPAEKGGIGQNLSGLTLAIQERFQGYPQFVAWMEGKDAPERIWGKKDIEKCQSPDDFLRLFQELEIPGDKWKNGDWLGKKAKLSIEEGGISKTLKGLYEAIQKRFQGYPQFVAWMEGKAEPEKTWGQKLEGCQSPDDFLRLFQSLKIPSDKWKSSNWLYSKAKLSIEEGGIGKNLSGLTLAIRQRFQGYPKFVAWMKGKDEPEKSWGQKVEGCKSPDDFSQLFQKLGIPGDKWKNINWLGRGSKLPFAEGGIGKPLVGLYEAIQKKFQGYPRFMAWMEGKEILEINSAEEAKDIIQKEADRLKMRVEELLNPAKIGDHLKESPVLKNALDYFANSKR